MCMWVSFRLLRWRRGWLCFKAVAIGGGEGQKRGKRAGQKNAACASGIGGAGCGLCGAAVGGLLQGLLHFVEEGVEFFFAHVLHGFHVGHVAGHFGHGADVFDRVVGQFELVGADVDVEFGAGGDFGVFVAAHHGKIGFQRHALV